MDIQGDNLDKKNNKIRVKVAIRVRPMVYRQLNQKSCVSCNHNNQIILGNIKSYKFDRVFNDNSKQFEIYQQCVKELVQKCFDGYNAAILAYGQTGSGKTYTMGTNIKSICNQEENGILPRVIKDIFENINQKKDKIQFIIKVSFLEIYNEQIIDLLSDDPVYQIAKNKQNISIRQEKDGSISIYGIVEEKVTNAAQMESILTRGSIHRSTSSTLMNQASSRSHAIFTITIQQHYIGDLYQPNNHNEQQDNQGYITAKFFFVDLAGSQRIKKTGATGMTLKEGININLGLLELGNVISALSTIEKNQDQFITYRNSKLTRILQDSLGGNSNTYMIACISPAQSSYQQSLNTLKYASKAMNIKNKPIINRDPQFAQISQLRQKIFDLQLQIRKLKQIIIESGIKLQQSINKQTDNTQNQLKILKNIYLKLQQKNQQIVNQLRQQKKKKNQLEIQNYQLKRSKDFIQLKIQKIKNIYPQLSIDILQDQRQKLLLQQYLSKIQILQNQLFDKQKINIQFQQEYQKIKKISQKDQKILIQKNKQIYILKKQNQNLKKQIKLLLDSNNNNISQNLDNKQSQSDQQQNLSNQQSQYEEQINQQTLSELKNVDKYIQQKQQHLKLITNNQIQLQYQLIAEMKQQYHNKINMLEKQKQNLINKKEDFIGLGDKSRYLQKIDSLEGQLKQYRKKVKQQKNIQKVIQSQNIKIKDLASQIIKFKIQKLQLSRKLKQDKQNYQKLKIQKMKQLLKIKKDNIKKDICIKKLTYRNQKNQQIVKKKQQQLKKVKKISKILKGFIKNKKKQQIKYINNISDQQYDKIIQKSLKHILYQIDKNIQLQKYQNKMKQIQKQLNQLLNQQSIQKIKLQRLKMNINQNQNQQIEQLLINLQDIKQRISNSQQNFQFCKQQYSTIIRTNNNKQYNLQIDLIYNQNYASIESLRKIIQSLYRSIKIIISQNYLLKQDKQKIQIQICRLKGQIQQYRQQISLINQQHRINLTKFRQQIITNNYTNSYQQDIHNSQYQSIRTGQRLDQKQRKNYQKKILDLTKANRQTTADVQMWRRKCTIIQDKYQNIKNLVHKDKFIGRPQRDQDTLMFKDKKNQTNSKNMITLDQVNQMLDSWTQIHGTKTKKGFNYDQVNEIAQKMEQSLIHQNKQPVFNKNKWQCLTSIDAHNSPILAMATHSNILISAATKSLKLWDLQTGKIISDISGIHLPGFIKYVVVHPQRKVMATACDKVITLWDLNTLNIQGILKGHREQVKVLHTVNDYLISAGKGLPNSGSLLVWDFKYLNPTSPLEEKEKNQDIFTITSKDNILYYGTRNHQVRRMNIENMEILSPFQPPHMDTVTGLTTLNNYLISGSKDKNLRLWSLDSAINNIKFTMHAFNDYINTIQSDKTLPIFYSGARDGQIKIGRINREKIEVVGGITSHSQSINAICPIQQCNRGIFATGSSDKTIKIWQPTLQTMHQIQKNY